MEPDMKRDPTELRRRLGADDWPSPGGERLFVAEFGFGGRELSGYRLVRAATPPVGPAAGARAVLSVWQAAGAEGPDRGADAIVLADVIEGDSPEAAAAALVELLGQFETPELDRRDGTGDVAFAYGEGSVSFVRGNLAVRVMVGGPGVESVAAAARELDAGLLARPDLDRTRLAPEFAEPPASRLAGKGRDRRAILDVAARDPQDRPLMLKVFTSTGSIERVDGQLTFRPDETGRHVIEVFAVAPDGDAVRAELAVETG
jgi:hypothetical protein